jgi:hypothetical protein
MSQIHELLPKIMAHIGTINKDQTNKVQNYKFRGIEQVLEKLSPALLANGCMLSTKVLDHKCTRWESGNSKDKHHATVLMEVTFIAPDGSSITNSMAGEALDTNGDKATAKACAGAFKYAAFLGLCIPTNTLEDPDRSPKKTGDKASPIEAAERAIRNAPDRKTVQRYLKAAAEKFSTDDYNHLQMIADSRVFQIEPTN